MCMTYEIDILLVAHVTDGTGAYCLVGCLVDHLVSLDMVRLTTSTAWSAIIAVSRGGRVEVRDSRQHDSELVRACAQAELHEVPDVFGPRDHSIANFAREMHQHREPAAVLHQGANRAALQANQVGVGPGRGAGISPGPFPGPPSAPDVRLSSHRGT